MKDQLTPDFAGAVTELLDAIQAKSATSQLEQSLNMANAKAKTGLAPDLYSALRWPLTMQDYAEYLDWFIRWAPDQTNVPAWTNPATGTAQEVYDHLCHFYFLVDQPVSYNGTTTTVQSIVPEAYVALANSWGSYLDTEGSWTEEQYMNFEQNSRQYRLMDYVRETPDAPYYTRFNTFFSRELKPGLRPITRPEDNTVPTFPADCTWRNTFAIDDQGMIPKITIKKTHNYDAVQQLLDVAKAPMDYSAAFNGGVFSHYFLAPYSYHRFHVPVSGKVVDIRVVQGQTFLEVNLKNGQFDAPDTATGGYEFRQARGIVTIDTAGSPHGDIGLVTVIPVGMCQVSSVNMYTQLLGTGVAKGDEFGYFQFGGSDIIALFEPKAQAVLAAQDSQYNYYGQALAFCQGS